MSIKKTTSMIALLCAIIVQSTQCMAPALGQIDESSDPKTLELMGRLCVNEASWNVMDCAIITHIRIRTARSHQRLLKDELVALHGRRSLRSDRASSPSPKDSRPWIGALNIRGTEPALWPDTMDWETQGKPNWGGILGTIQGVLRGEIGDPCHGTPNTWGNRGGDHTRALRLGFRQVDCGSTANMFWRM